MKESQVTEARSTVSGHHAGVMRGCYVGELLQGEEEWETAASSIAVVESAETSASDGVAGPSASGTLRPPASDSAVADDTTAQSRLKFLLCCVGHSIGVLLYCAVLFSVLVIGCCCLVIDALLKPDRHAQGGSSREAPCRSPSTGPETVFHEQDS